MLVRSEAGQVAFSIARDLLEVGELERPEALLKLDALNKKQAFASLKRPFDPRAPLFIDYEEHLRHYQNTDRAPVTHDAVRY